MRYVLGFLFNNDGSEVVLIEKKTPEWQQGKLNGVGGKIEPTDPTTKHSMMREFKEEAGVQVSTWKKFATLSGEKYVVHCFMAKDDTAYLNAHTCEAEMVVKVFVSQLHNVDVVPNLRWLIPLALEQNIEQVEIFDKSIPVSC